MPRGEFDRSERRARTRAQLLEAAARVYAEKGVDAATLDEVAEEAGFTKGAVYDHFGSKENLLFALLDEFLSREIGDQLSLFEANRELTGRPAIGAERWLTHVQEDPDAFRLFVEAWVKGQRDEAVRERVVAGIDAWRAMFHTFATERGRELGLERNPEFLDAHANIMVALGAGFAVLKLADPDGVPSALLGAAYLVMIGAIEASDEARALIESAVTPAERPRS
jgi:AcrR family transcriptional regulator